MKVSADGFATEGCAVTRRRGADLVAKGRRQMGLAREARPDRDLGNRGFIARKHVARAAYPTLEHIALRRISRRGLKRAAEVGTAEARHNGEVARAERTV